VFGNLIVASVVSVVIYTKQWRSQDLEVGGTGGLVGGGTGSCGGQRASGEQKSPSGVQGHSPWWVVRGGGA